MRILVAQHVPRARTGGMSRIMGFIHDHIVAAGHNVDYVCAEDVPVHLDGRLARFTFPMLVRKRAVTAARSGKPYDIINVHEPSSAAVSINRKPMGSPKVVVTTHGVEQRSWKLRLEDMRDGREKLSMKTRVTYPITSLSQSSFGLRRADHIFCLNSEDRDYLSRWLKVPKQRITRICPGADIEYSKVAERRSYDTVQNLLFAGTWLTRKGIEDVVTSFSVLAAKHRGLRLSVLGAGMSEELVRAAFPEKIRLRVSCIQTSNEAETVSAFANSDIYLLPSLFEGTPLTLIEAMMSGMPIVTTATCGMKDVIRDNENGLLVPVRSPELIVQSIEQLIHDRSLRGRLGRTATDRALSDFTWERVAMPVLDAYVALHGDVR